MLATFRLWAEVSREAAMEGLAVLHICFCNLSNNYKWQLVNVKSTETETRIWSEFLKERKADAEQILALEEKKSKRSSIVRGTAKGVSSKVDHLH